METHGRSPRGPHRRVPAIAGSETGFGSADRLDRSVRSSLALFRLSAPRGRRLRLLVVICVGLGIGAACRDEPAFDEGAMVELLARAGHDANLETRRQKIDAALAVLVPAAEDHRRARPLELRALAAMAELEAAENRQDSAREWGARRDETARRHLGDDGGDGAMRAVVASRVAMGGDLEAGWALLMKGIDATDRDEASLMPLLQTAHVLIAYVGARGDEVAKARLRSDTLRLIRHARSVAESGGGAAFRRFTCHGEGELLMSLGRLDDAWVCLWDLEKLEAGAIETQRLRLALEDLGPEPRRDG